MKKKLIIFFIKIVSYFKLHILKKRKIIVHIKHITKFIISILKKISTFKSVCRFNINFSGVVLLGIRIFPSSSTLVYLVFFF